MVFEPLKHLLRRYLEPWGIYIYVYQAYILGVLQLKLGQVLEYYTAKNFYVWVSSERSLHIVDHGGCPRR